MIIPDKEDGKVEVNSKIPHQATPEVSQALSFYFGKQDLAKNW